MKLAHPEYYDKQLIYKATKNSELLRKNNNTKQQLKHVIWNH